MKKLLLGCLGVVLIFAVLGAVLTYVFVVQPAGRYLGQVAQLARLQEIERDVENTSPFRPPPSGALSPSMVEGFAGVHEYIQERLGGRLEELKTKYERLDRQLAEEGGRAGVAELLGATGDLIDLLLEAKRAQVEALNRAGYSLEEYYWIRGRVLTAAGLEAHQRGLAEVLAGAGGPAAAKHPAPDEATEISSEDRELVGRYRQRIAEWMAMATLGL